MNFKPKPTKKQLKIFVAVLLFSIVAVRWNQQRPELRSKQVDVQQPEAKKQANGSQTPAKPFQSNNKAAAALQKELANTNPVAQKRYYLLDTPNDTYYNSTWYFQRVNASAAWNVTNDSQEVTIAVIDSGFALNHQDLTSQWKINTGEYGEGMESDGIDNDNNGYIDDFRGWDYVDADNQPQAGTLNTTGLGVSHGTETAGLAGATSNNGQGNASIARNVKLLPLQAIDDNGNGFSNDVAQAILYAIDQGADVINMSLGTSGDDPIVRAAINIAFENNVIVVAAAGNCGSGNNEPCTGQVPGYVTFPANYNRVIAVGATDTNNNRASFSSYGERLDIMAPGAGTLISTTWSSSNGTTLYASNLNGTSYASPIVASSAALIRSIRPNTSIDDVRALLMGAAQKLSPMSGQFYSQSYGHGLLNIGQAITIANDLNNTTEAEPAFQQTAGIAAEHVYNTREVIGSGCLDNALTWCTVWLRNDRTNSERFLPYTKTNSQGFAGWNISAAALNPGVWQARARQGDIMSTVPYELFTKSN